MYKSPFMVSLMDEVAKEVGEGIDGLVMKATANANITVDKDELVKALAYDRGQYDKGYCDGYQDGKRDAMEVVRCKDCKWWKTGYFWNGTERKVCAIEPYEPCRDPNDYCSRGERRGGADE